MKHQSKGWKSTSGYVFGKLTSIGALDSILVYVENARANFRNGGNIVEVTPVLLHRLTYFV